MIVGNWGVKLIFSIFNRPLHNKEIRQVLLSTEQEDIDSTNLNSNHLTLQINDHSSSIFTEEGPEPADHKESVQEWGAGPSEVINNC